MSNIDEKIGEEKDRSSKGSLLVVDDDVALLSVLEKLLVRHYEVKTATSGEEALQILNAGYRPHVIISDQKMPSLTGGEFLEQTIKIVPNAIRIILTGNSSPKEIIEAMNKARAYMFLLKPVNELQLAQALKIAFDYYNAKIIDKKKIYELQQNIKVLTETNEKLLKSLKNYRDLGNLFIEGIAKIIAKLERFYFTPHTYSVANICKAVAEYLEFEPSSVQLLYQSALLHYLPFLNFPDKFKLADPFDPSFAIYLEQYSTMFLEGLSPLKDIPNLTNHIKIISQQLEHNDGSGIPNKLANIEISKEAHILILATTFHNYVYRLPAGLLDTFKSEGIIAQSRETTFNRYNEALKSMYRKANWYDYDIFHSFQELVKKRAIPELTPYSDTLILKDPSYELLHKSLAKPKEIQEELVETEQTTTSQDEDFVIRIIGDREVKYKEVEIPVKKLTPGMILSHSVVTKKGLLVAKAETMVDAAILRKIRTLEQVGSLPSSITVLVPIQNESQEKEITQF